MGGSMSCSSIVINWLMTTFKGHVIAYSVESPVNHPFKSQKSNMHYFGPAVRPTKYDEVVYFLQDTWYGDHREELPPRAMVDSNLYPRGSQEYFMIYFQSNCVPYRDAAAGRLSENGPVHCTGHCQWRSPPSGDRSNLISHYNASSNWDMSRSHYKRNADIYSKYRFCLVMENNYQPGYITEKILMAFIAGCIPVYYGTESIFDIFNENSFVFYNISDPQSALEKIRTLESDKDAYEQMLMSEPIAAHGNSTIEDYFSFDDTIGNGALKRRLRGKLGLTDLNFVP